MTLPVRAADHSRDLPAGQPLTGRVMTAEPTPGKYGHAEINGVQFAVTRIELRLGAIIFHCTLMIPASYPFTVSAGSPARIYGVDGSLIADYGVPGITGMQECHVAPGQLATIMLPVQLGEVASVGGDLHDNRFPVR